MPFAAAETVPEPFAFRMPETAPAPPYEEPITLPFQVPVVMAPVLAVTTRPLYEVAPVTAPVAVVVEPEPPSVPVALEAAPAPAPAVVADTSFWPVETSERRRYSLPISAVLEAAAVLMILIFILLRLS